MDKSSCQWIRGRLPLWVGPADDARDPGGDGDDLSALDRRSIEAHLGICPACREHRSGLARAREALDLAAVAPPPLPEAPSLWPALEQRIAARQSHDRSPTSRARESAAERARVWAALDDDRPLRLAWMQDTLREVVEAAGWNPCPDRSRRGRSGPSPRAGLVRGRILGASLAASILAILVVLPVTWRVRAAAAAKIHDNVAPVAMSARPADPTEAERPDPSEPAPVPSRDIPAGQLAQAEPVKPPADPRPSNDAASGPKSAAPTRYGYDLQQLIPMPLDGRDDKPVY